jgi:serine/threonine-protein kinase
LWQEAFAAKPALAQNPKTNHRYNAACAAARAGCGQGEDAPPLDAEQRARWRQQALEWLRADLALWNKQLDNPSPKVRSLVQRTLRHWQRDPDLAGLREAAALANLPEAEAKTCCQLWADVEALLTRTSAK